ncbi:hypothetical protein PTKIN_Ptkin19aG0072000 [Pterospermum kingtungense]
MTTVIFQDRDPRPMRAAKLADAVTTRLKREDHHWTKHDSQFSKWKVLIGPDDWEDFSLGKEGVTRYRVENLPRNTSSGLYELGIYRSGSSRRDSAGKLDPLKVLVVYLGEADNVRTRLQQYGRTGAHLGRNDSGEKGCGCFEDIFTRGYSIVYRWAPMENKADARKIEAQLLNTFDYAWNKGSNGTRRHDDILQKLDKRASTLTKLATLSRKHLSFLQKQVGIKIEASKLLSHDNEFSKYDDGESYNFLQQVFKFSRSQPRSVLDHSVSNDNDTSITCGVVLEDCSICRRPPVEGRKRCAAHKGKKTKGSSVRLSTSEQSPLHKACSEYVVPDNGEINVHEEKIGSFGLVPSLAGDYAEIEQFSPICGVAMDDGSLCGRQPVSGRKRCDLHKGRRICSSNSDRTRYQTVPYVVFDSYANEVSGFDTKSSELFPPQKVETGVSLEWSVSSDGSDDTICGVELGDGYFCRKQPVRGIIRCEDHKGMKVTTLLSGLYAKTTSDNWNSSNSNYSPHYSNYGDSSSKSICGAPCRNGSFCQRKVKGNGRCWQH